MASKKEAIYFIRLYDYFELIKCAAQDGFSDENKKKLEHIFMTRRVKHE